MQMWADFLAAGFDRKKTDEQPNALLLELWRQLRSEQQFTKFGKRRQQEIRVLQLEDYMASIQMLFSTLKYYKGCVLTFGNWMAPCAEVYYKGCVL